MISIHRRFVVLALMLALTVGLSACGGSKVSSDSAKASSEAKATGQQVLKQDPKVKAQALYAENHFLACGLKVHGHLLKQHTTFLTCEHFTPQEIQRGKTCLDSSLKDVSLFALHSKPKRDQIVINTVKCVTQ